MTYTDAPKLAAVLAVTYAHAAEWLADARRVKADPAIRRNKAKLIGCRVHMARLVHRAARIRATA